MVSDERKLKTVVGRDSPPKKGGMPGWKNPLRPSLTLKDLVRKEFERAKAKESIEVVYDPEHHFDPAYEGWIVRFKRSQAVILKVNGTTMEVGYASGAIRRVSYNSDFDAPEPELYKE